MLDKTVNETVAITRNEMVFKAKRNIKNVDIFGINFDENDYKKQVGNVPVDTFGVNSGENNHTKKVGDGAVDESP